MFNIKSTLGRDYSVDLNDSLRAKKALRELGYFETPEFGLTPYPDHRLFDALVRFQTDHGLRRDGVMRPQGETAAVLGNALAAERRSTKGRQVSKSSRNCPPGFQEVTETICIPGTTICIHRKRCKEISSAGGTRA